MLDSEVIVMIGPIDDNRDDWNETDHKYGWKYGCDGIMGISYVCEYLSLSNDDVYDLITLEKLRAGNMKLGGEKYKVLICRKSVLEYAASKQ